MQVVEAPPRPATAMDIAAETENLLQSLRQDNVRQQDEIRGRKEALLLKLRAKSAPASTQVLFPPKSKALSSHMHIPVARATSHPLLNSKKRMLGEMKKAARKQGADSMAKLFGYKSYVEQKEHLEKEEHVRIQLMELKKKSHEAAKANHPIPDNNDDDESSDEDFVPEVEATAADSGVDGSVNGDVDEGAGQSAVPVSDEEGHDERDVGLVAGAPPRVVASDDQADRMAAAGLSPDDDDDDGDHLQSSGDEHDDDDARSSANGPPTSTPPREDTNTLRSIRRRRLHRPIATSSDEDENDADHSDIEADLVVEKARRNTTDKAANYRAILAADQAAESGRRRDKRLQTGGLLNLVESEAEEEEDEDVLKIGGLGDFGFGVAAPPKPAEQERETDLALRDDDLDNIVDELSDDEQGKHADEYFRERMDAQDKQQVHEVMRNVREGFGRNRRVFSSSLNGEARGRFNLDQLVAADGSKYEAARLGLLESDEEKDEDEDGMEKGEVEEDEEERMERELRERYQRHPKIYITSSESESSDSEPGQMDKENDDDVPSDEEREARQIKLFSAKAKINRRMQRMMQVQANEPKPALNALDEIDDKELEQVVVLSTSTSTAMAPPLPPMPSVIQSGPATTTASFTRMVDSRKLFHVSASKAFIFTTTNDDSLASTDDKASSQLKRRAESAHVPSSRKKPALHKRPGSLFAALSSFQCN
ncbi:hypothetical protein H257_04839 [Aphanomyces astaci]|uniref:DNA replication checkpoint mediator MRC1 domain-containing protein n=1 Tax=Aphanomyces astaci TaxID=112090 RepID=W4GTV4_APHAT|nr:hypothetical protein H257_04839 [Aphanomyces astaci]ETV83112.1 hypothetical protein H257_04839 [Aphanomyces astaci]|eukprot:XP_009827783.1 hypothetical protein H257_04839 [Aphanomyces astaci]